MLFWGMDWLSSYWAVIDCYRQRVTVCTLSGECFHFLGDRVGSVLPPMYDLRGRNKLSGLLASFMSSECDETRTKLPKWFMSTRTSFLRISLVYHLIERLSSLLI